MAVTANGFRFPLPSDPPDGSGGLSALASDLDAFLQQGNWTPSLGGSGATLGSGGGVNQYSFFSRVGAALNVSGYLYMGSGGSWGTGAAAIAGIPDFDINNVAGTGLIEAPGSPPAAFSLEPQNSSTFYIRVIRDKTTEAAFTLGTPASGTTIKFALTGRKA